MNKEKTGNSYQGGERVLIVEGVFKGRYAVVDAVRLHPFKPAEQELKIVLLGGEHIQLTSEMLVPATPHIGKGGQ